MATVPLEEGVPLVFAIVVVIDAIRGVLPAVEGVATVRPLQRPDLGIGMSPCQEARRVVRRLRREGAQAPVFLRLVTPVALFVTRVGRGERERESCDVGQGHERGLGRAFAHRDATGGGQEKWGGGLTDHARRGRRDYGRQTSRSLSRRQRPPNNPPWTPPPP